jgi:glycosyltransferase involved in cell wall biosynthesis
VIGRMYHAAAICGLFRQFGIIRAPVLWTIHHSFNNLDDESRSTRLAIGACRLLSNVPQAIVYVSRRSAEQHVAYGYCAKKSVVIPNGYDAAHFRFDGDARKKLRAEWGFSDSDLVIGHVARMHAMKDHDSMISAFRLAEAKNRRLRLVFCGADFESLAVPDDIKPVVRALGLRKDVSEVMSACDIGALSSSHGEAFPNVLAEFMACERPCVTTDVGDAAEIVADYGRVVLPRDPEAFAESLLEIARLDEIERLNLGRAARKSIFARFDIRSVAARHTALWHQTIGNYLKPESMLFKSLS